MSQKRCEHRARRNPVGLRISLGPLRSELAVVVALLGAWLSVGCSGQDEKDVGFNPRDGSMAERAAATRPQAGSIQAATSSLFSCPTVAVENIENAVAQKSELSPFFQRVCSNCHGTFGQGQGNYPSLPGALTLDEYRAIVRQGTTDRGMPAFAATQITDDDLASDYASLKHDTSTASATPPTEEFSWPQERVDQAYRDGLAAFRKPDPKGASCASCHSPDAIDLAVIAYDDATLFRRGLLHLESDDVTLIRDLVHAQRRRFNITTPCSTEWRPFQPGGEPLPGNTPPEQDHSFAEYLKARNILVMTGQIDSLEAAKEAWEQFAKLDLRTLRIGIPLPKWTHDPFHGEKEQSFNDWIPPLNVNGDNEQLIAASDRYLADPSDDHYFALEEAAVGELGNSNAGLYKDWFNNAVRNKRRASLLASHFFRLALLGKRGWFERPAYMFPELGQRGVRYSPFALLGGMTQEFSCNDNGGSFGGGTCSERYQSFPEDQRIKFGGPDDASMNARFEEFTHAWWTVGELFDQPLLGSEDNAIDGGAFYWSGRFAQSDIHLPFFFAHIIAAKADVFANQPELAMFEKPAEVDVLLNENAMSLRGPLGLTWAPDEDSINFDDGVRLRANMIRMFAYLQIDALQRNAKVIGKKNLRELWGDPGIPNIGLFLGEMQRYSRDDGFAARHPAIAANITYYTDGLGRLIDTVLALLDTAEDQKR